MMLRSFVRSVLQHKMTAWLMQLSHLPCSSTLDPQVHKYTHCLKTTQNIAFDFSNFPPFFVLLKVTCLVTLFGRKLQVFKKLVKMGYFLIYF